MSAGHRHDHDHDHEHGPGGRLGLALVATAAVAVLEFGGGIASGSLALLADSAHVAMDVVALLIALLAAAQARRPANDRRTFGYARAEILAALGNAALLAAVTTLVVVEALHRFSTPEAPKAGLMAIVAAIGLAVNVAIGLTLARHAHGNLNARAAVLHVAGDALGALAVLIGGLVIARTGAAWIDPALSLLVCAIIVWGIAAVAREAADVLLESAPPHASLPNVRARIVDVDGVVGVHDLHVWTLGSGSYAAAAHVVLDDRRLSEAAGVLRRIEAALADRFEIRHTTVQFECEACGPDTAIVCSQASRDPFVTGEKSVRL